MHWFAWLQFIFFKTKKLVGITGTMVKPLLPLYYTNSLLNAGYKVGLLYSKKSW
jgi:hypothetical protein